MSFVYKILVAIAFNAVILYFLTTLVDGIAFNGGLKFFVLGGFVLGIINSIIRPIIKALSLPLIFITGGLFLIVINVGVLFLLSHVLNSYGGGEITLVFQNFSSYVIGAIVFGVINWTLSLIK